MKVKDFMIGLFFCCLSGGASGYIAYRLTRKKYEKLADEEIKSVISKQKVHEDWLLESYGINRNIEEPTKKEPVKASPITVVPSMVKSGQDRLDVEKKAYTNYAKKYTTEEPTNNDIYVITPEEFNGSTNASQTLYYYINDGVITDTDNNRINNYREVIGKESIWKNKFSNNDDLYIRNDNTEIDYEVLIKHENWSDEASDAQKAGVLLEVGELTNDD